MKNVSMYMAPMEELSGYVFRNTLQKLYGGVDRFFSPFITAAPKRGMKTREARDVEPSNNAQITLIPQILAGNARGFMDVAMRLSDMGYREVNLNLGCPSGTVVSKGKGSGMLRDPEHLRAVLDEIFETAEREAKGLKISAKTRIGITDPGEWDEIVDVLLDFPFSELIIHPRVQKQFYKGKPEEEAFRYVYEKKKMSAHGISLIYNGDISTPQDYCSLIRKFPDIRGVMIGRGAMADPSIFRQIRAAQEGSDIDKAQTGKEELREWHDALYKGYQKEIPSEKDVMHKMKEVWTYMGRLFEDAERPVREILKAGRPEEYRAEVQRLFALYKLKNGKD